MISVILPAYNERENAVSLVRSIADELRPLGEFEVLVVDDNSPDGTGQAVNDLGIAGVRAIVRTEDRGFAKSIRCGLENARGDILVIMDSDWNHQPKYLPIMIQALEHYDCVSGSRFVYGGRMNSRRRHLMSWGFNIFTRVMTSGQITDSLYGFVAIHRHILERVDFDDVFWGYGDYCIRLMFYLQRLGASVLQIPVINGERHSGEGNDKFLRTFWQYFREVVALSVRIRKRGSHAPRG